MAVGSSVIWTHCSIRYKVTSGINRGVRADQLPPPAPLARPTSRPRRRVDATSSFPPYSLARSRPLALPRIRADGLCPRRPA
jgi:hypothetical protein